MTACRQARQAMSPVLVRQGSVVSPHSGQQKPLDQLSCSQ